MTWAPLGIRPAQILRGIASGLLGPKSFHGGWQTAALGAVLHFLIAGSAAGLFYGASRKLRFLTRRPVVSGVLYGIAVYAFMYWVVMPLSAYHKPPIFNRRNDYRDRHAHRLCRTTYRSGRALLLGRLARKSPAAHASTVIVTCYRGA